MPPWESTNDKLHSLGWSIGMMQYIGQDGVLYWNVDAKHESVWIVETGLNLDEVYEKLFQKVAGGRLIRSENIVFTGN